MVHQLTQTSWLVLLCIFLGCGQKADNSKPIALDNDSQLAIDADQFIREAKLHCVRSEFDQAHEAAMSAVQCINQSSDPIESFVLEKIAFGNRTITVRVNTAHSQRKPDESSAVRSYSFHVATVGSEESDGSSAEVLDYETRTTDGADSTKAMFVRTVNEEQTVIESAQANTTYDVIREEAIGLLNKTEAIARAMPLEDGGKTKFLNLEVAGLDLSRRPFFVATKYGNVAVGVFNSLRADVGSDISAMVETPAGWARLGSNGFGITSFSDGYVFGLTVDARDRIWLLVRFNDFSEPKTNERWFLYCYENDLWTIKGPAEGHPNKMLDAAQLVVLDDGTPVFHHFVVDEKHRKRPRIDFLRNGEWTETPVSKILGVAEECYIDRSPAKVLHILRRDKEASTYAVYKVTSLEATELPDPIDKFQSEKHIDEMVVNSKGDIASVVLDQGNARVFLRSREVASRTIKLFAAPEDMQIYGVNWDHKDQLIIAGVDDESVFGFKRIDDQWQPVGAVKFESEIQFLKLFVGKDNQPVATWMTGFSPFGL